MQFWGVDCGNELSMVGQLCEETDSEKKEKYQPLQWELTKHYPGYKILQLNFIMDIVFFGGGGVGAGGWSKELDVEVSKIFGVGSKLL